MTTARSSRKSSRGRTATRAPAKKPAAKPAMPKRGAAKRATPKTPAAKRAASTPAKRVVPGPAKRAAPKRAASKKPAAKPLALTPPAARPSAATWTSFVEAHGVVLASARGPVPSVAEAIAGEPIVGSWWSHPKAQEIFDALGSIDDSEDIRCFKLVDKKITFVHRRLWPALTKLAQVGALSADRVASIQQEHTATGEHRNITIEFPDWVPHSVAASAKALSVEDARAELGSWLR